MNSTGGTKKQKRTREGEHMYEVITMQLRKFNWRSFWRSCLFGVVVPGLAYLGQDYVWIESGADMQVAAGLSMLFGFIARSVEGSFGSK